MIETNRLKIYVASNGQMEQFIERQTVKELQIAYREMLDGCLAHPTQRQWYALWMIELKDGTHVGELCFKGVLDHRTEIGYGIESNFQGLGYATEAVNALANWALEQNQVACVWAEVDETNVASQKVLAKSGFTQTCQKGKEGIVFIRKKTLFDISQPLLNCEVFPGDPAPTKTSLMQMKNGNLYNLSAISMCVHNGTHVDAPLHFIKDGKGVDQIALDKFVGQAFVVTHDGNVTKSDAKQILNRAKQLDATAWKKILIKGQATLTLEAAEFFADAQIDLVGNESQTVGPVDSPMPVHLALLGKDVVLLEGVRLAGVPDGVYLLCCAPLNVEQSDGSPCRAVLIDTNPTACPLPQPNEGD